MWDYCTWNVKQLKTQVKRVLIYCGCNFIKLNEGNHVRELRGVIQLKPWTLLTPSGDCLLFQAQSYSCTSCKNDKVWSKRQVWVFNIGYLHKKGTSRVIWKHIWSEGKMYRMQFCRRIPTGFDAINYHLSHMNLLHFVMFQIKFISDFRLIFFSHGWKWIFFSPIFFLVRLLFICAEDILVEKHLTETQDTLLQNRSLKFISISGLFLW